MIRRFIMYDIKDREKMLGFIIDYKDQHDGIAPSIRDIMPNFNITSESVMAYLLNEMEQDGWIKMLRNKKGNIVARGIMITEDGYAIYEDLGFGAWMGFSDQIEERPDDWIPYEKLEQRARIGSKIIKRHYDNKPVTFEWCTQSKFCSSVDWRYIMLIMKDIGIKAHKTWFPETKEEALELWDAEMQRRGLDG